jgi:stage IV sporulation protein FB
VFLNEPPRSAYDLRFHLLGIPVRVHPMFWLVALLMGVGGSRERTDIAIWVGVAFVSILVHEMGHALAALAHGWQPSITLYAMGGLASYQPTRHEPLSRILITLAGPFAGFVFAAVVAAGIVASGHTIRFVWESGWSLPFYWEPPYARRAESVISDLLYINIYWGLVNLLPIYPLDGGQIARELFSLNDADNGVRLSLWLSVFAGAALAVVSLVKFHQQFQAFFFGYLAFLSYQELQARYGIRGGWGDMR